MSEDIMTEATGLSAQFGALKAAARALGFENVDSWVLMHTTTPKGVQTFRLYADAEGELKLVFGLPTLMGLSQLEASEKLTTMAEVLVALEHARQEDDARYRAHGIKFYGDASGGVTLNCIEHPEWYACFDVGEPLGTMVATARGHHNETYGI